MSRKKSLPSGDSILTYARLNKSVSRPVRLSRESVVDSERTFSLFGSSFQTGIVLPRELRLVYMMHPLANRGIEARVNAIFARGFKIVHPDKSVVDDTEDWMKRVNFYSVLRDWARNAFLYGQAHIEVVPSSSGSDVDELVVLPNDVDYIRDENGRIVFGPDRKPKGFEQRPSNIDSNSKGGAGDAILFSNPIARLTFTRLNGQYEGVSLLQPCFRLLVHDLNIQESVAIAISRHGYAQLDVSVGSPEAPPNQSAIDDVANQLEDLNSSNEFIHAYTTQVKVLESNSARSYESYNQLFIKQIVSQLGVPEPVLLGTGENSNRSTSDTQGRFYHLQAAADQMSVSIPCDNIIFTKLAEYRGWSEPPSLEWDETFPEDETQRIGQVATMFEKTIISREEARELLGFDVIGDFGDFSPSDSIIPSNSVPGPESRGDPGVVPDPGKSVDKDTVKPRTDPNPKAKGRSAMMSLEKELSNDLFLFDGFVKNSLLNSSSGDSLVELSSFSKEFGDRLYNGLKHAYKLGLSDSFVVSGFSSRGTYLSKSEVSFISDYSDSLSVSRFDKLSSDFRSSIGEHLSTGDKVTSDVVSVVLDSLFSNKKAVGRGLLNDSYDTFSRTELWKFYNKGLLAGFSDAGVSIVSRSIEPSCDNCMKCSVCNSTDYSSISLSSAGGLLPVHPNCRCFWSIS